MPSYAEIVKLKVILRRLQNRVAPCYLPLLTKRGKKCLLRVGMFARVTNVKTPKNLLRWGCVLLLAPMVVGVQSSCSVRQIGATVAGAATYYGTKELLDSEDEKRIKKGKAPLTDAQRTLILTTASALGSVIGSEIAGGVEEYVVKKREEYRSEAEYLQAHVDDLRDMCDDMDDELAWLEEQNTTLQEQAKNVKKMPALRKEMASRLNDAADKRYKDAKDVEKYLNAARKDAMKAYSSSSDAAKKAELKKEIAALDSRIARTRKVSKSLLATKSRVVS